MALLAGLPQSASAGVVLPDPSNSPVSHAVNRLYLLIFILSLVVLIAVIGSLVVAARRRIDDTANEAVTAEAAASTRFTRTTLDASLAVFVILAVFGALSFASASSPDKSNAGVPADYKPAQLTGGALNAGPDLKPPAGPSISVHVNGQQYLWRYDYAGLSTAYSYHDLVIPVGVTVMLDVTSSDVAHAWWVPQLGGSIEALPGYINRGWIRAEKPGTYVGSSTMLSGTNYPSMTTRVIAVPPEDFDAWVTGKEGEISDALTKLGEERKSGKEEQLVEGTKGATGSPGVEGDIGGPSK